MFITAIICIAALLVLAVYSVIDLHASVVILKSYAPEAELSRTAQLSYDFVERFKK